MILNIPIFPLEGVIFFPGTNLPLNIFEPRYLQMVDYALKKDKLIGMIQSKNKDELYSTGCLGKITSFEQTSDGRYVINLTGQNYFSPKKELTSKNKFRIVQANIIELNIKFTNQNLDQVNKTSLLDLYKNFISPDSESMDLSLIKDVDTSILIKFMAMTSPFSVADKQMLLETFHLKKMSDNLEILFEYYLAKKKNQQSIN